MTTHFISGPQPMHGTYLMRRQCFAEQIYCRRLPTEHTLFVQFGSRADVTLVEWLNCISNSKLVNIGRNL